jgi:hypothetical protein
MTVKRVRFTLSPVSASMGDHEAERDLTSYKTAALPIAPRQQCRESHQDQTSPGPPTNAVP